MPVAAPGQSAPSVSPLRFGPSGRFELQPAERRLLVDGQPAALGGRALDLLITLAARPDHLLSKNELLDRVWPGLVVEEANLQMQVSNLRKLLGGDVIATVPGRGYRFTAAVEKRNESVPGPATGAPSTLPASAPQPPAQRLFGRDADLARLEGLLTGSGCVTLVGTSGVGKTSLARAAMARWQGRSVWIDLAALVHGSQVAGALARPLGVQLGDGEAAPQLLSALQGRTLLVLDNAEHLVQTCAELVAQLCAAPGVQVLVTSQLPLAIAVEHVQRLDPLALPSPAATELGDDALALLVERIVAADHRFRVTPAALPLLHAICKQLDGLPLALEMAAARVPLIGLKGVHDALAQRFALLTRGHRDAATRHRTLHNALDWSYRLLAEPEQRLFRALGTFAGGFTLELAVRLTTDNDEERWDVIEGLANLVDRSLVVVSADDPPRYRLLETMRAFALEQLTHENEVDAVRKRHAGAVLALFARHFPGNTVTLPLCLPEMENARDAIAWAQVHDLDCAARLTAQAASVSTFSVWRAECTNWMVSLEALLLQPAGMALPAEVRAHWWTELARMLSVRRDLRASSAAQRAVALWGPLQRPEQSVRAAMVWVRTLSHPGPELDRACDELRTRVAAVPDLPPRPRLLAHSALVHAADLRGDHAAVLAGRLSELALAEELGEQDPIDAAACNVLAALNMLGRHAEAAERGRALLERIDRDRSETNGNLPYVFGALLEALTRSGQLDEAQALGARAWRVCLRFGAPEVAAPLALLAASKQRFAVAARLVGHALACHAARGLRVSGTDERLLERVEAMATDALGKAQVEALIREGRLLSDEAAVALSTGSEP